MSSLSSVSATSPVSSDEHLGRGRRRGDTEHGPPVGAELGDGRREGGGLAGAGRADDEHDVGVPATAAAPSAWAGFRSSPLRVTACRFVDAVVGEPTVDPVDQCRFLVEDRLCGERTVDDRLGDGRPSLRSSASGSIGLETSMQ